MKLKSKFNPNDVNFLRFFTDWQIDFVPIYVTLLK